MAINRKNKWRYLVGSRQGTVRMGIGAGGSTATKERTVGHAYQVIDADGHILEPLDLWDNYIDPKFRDRAPRIVKGKTARSSW